VPGNWTEVTLGQVLRHRKEFIEIEDSRSYKRCRARQHAQGIVLRDTVSGVEIRTKRQQVCRAGDFLVAEIDAKVGGFGIVPADLDGAIVSSHYFLFDVEERLLDRRFLGYFLRTASFQDQVLAQGSTNYAAVRPSDVLTYRAPLPPINEQRRVVARIQELAAKIEWARELRRRALEETNSLVAGEVSSLLQRLSRHSVSATVGSISVSITDGDHQPPPRSESGVPFLLISNITHGWLDFSNCRWVAHAYFNGLQPTRTPARGDVLYTAVGATYGTPCLVDTDRPFCFQRHIAIIKPDRERILPEYLWWALRSRDVYDQATSGVTGSAQPTVPLRAIRKLRLPLPAITEQRSAVAWLARLEARVRSCTQLLRESTAALDALPPALLDRAFRGAL